MYLGSMSSRCLFQANGSFSKSRRFGGFSPRAVKRNDTNLNIEFQRENSTFISTVDSFLRFSTSNPLYTGTESVFQFIHSTSGLPWWLSIIGTTICLRTVIFTPALIIGEKSAAKLLSLKEERDRLLKEITSKVKHAKWVYKWNDEQYLESLRKSQQAAISQFYTENKVHPLQSYAIKMVQLPVFIIVSLTLRTMTGSFGHPAVEGFMSEGGPWFPSLIASDSTMILPLALGSALLLKHLISQKVIPSPASLSPSSIRIQRRANLTMYLLSAAMVPVSALFPSCLSLYWLTSTMFDLLQCLVMYIPGVRRILGIPYHPNEPDITRLIK